RGQRIVLVAEAGRLRVPMAEMRLEKGALGSIVAPAGGERRQGMLRRFRVGEGIRPVRPLVDGGAAEFGEPDRLAAGLPGGRFGDLDAGAPVVMRIGPPADEVLVA